MRSLLALALAAVVVSGVPSTALAQRSGADRADRGQRLDSDSFRNDMLQDQLKKPATPLVIQPAPSTTTGDKPKPKTR